MAMLPARSWRLASHAHRLHDLITPSVGKRFSAPSPSFMDKSALPSAARSNKVESTTSVGHEAGPSTRVVVVAIDPDTKGAIALASWMASPSVTSVKEPEVSSTGVHEAAEKVYPCQDPASVRMMLFDMPCASIELSRKHKKTGKPVVRRWGDVHAARQVVIRCLQDLIGSDRLKDQLVPTPDPAPIPTVSGSLESISHGSHPSTDVEMRAYIEAPPIFQTNSSISRAPVLYSMGMWHGMLTMAGFSANTVPPRHWKADWDLVGKDKEESRLLAINVFPHFKDMLKLKKHHGRAEALLIAAWAMGCSVCKDTGELMLGSLRMNGSTDAYGNLVLYTGAGEDWDSELDDVPEAMDVEALTAAKEAAAEAKKAASAASKKKSTLASKARRSKALLEAEVEGLVAAAAPSAKKGKRSKALTGAEVEGMVAAAAATAPSKKKGRLKKALIEVEVEGLVAAAVAAPSAKKIRRSKALLEADVEGLVAAAAAAAPSAKKIRRSKALLEADVEGLVAAAAEAAAAAAESESEKAALSASQKESTRASKARHSKVLLEAEVGLTQVADTGGNEATSSEVENDTPKPGRRKSSQAADTGGTGIVAPAVDDVKILDKVSTKPKKKVKVGANDNDDEGQVAAAAVAAAAPSAKTTRRSKALLEADVEGLVAAAAAAAASAAEKAALPASKKESTRASKARRSKALMEAEEMCSEATSSEVENDTPKRGMRRGTHAADMGGSGIVAAAVHAPDTGVSGRVAAAVHAAGTGGSERVAAAVNEVKILIKGSRKPKKKVKVGANDDEDSE